MPRRSGMTMTFFVAVDRSDEPNHFRGEYPRGWSNRQPRLIAPCGAKPISPSNQPVTDGPIVGKRAKIVGFRAFASSRRQCGVRVCSK
jgi:hypothetical protein